MRRHLQFVSTTVSLGKEPEKRSEAERAQPVMVCTDSNTGAVLAAAVAKGADPFAQETALEALRFCGHDKTILMSDPEASVKAL